ncbi:hypothetical protein BDL97_07G067100 [Sphagnum fallax]|nr:hypothetical protein BDL97_07G067100 [Sphagnum fallax]
MAQSVHAAVIPLLKSPCEDSLLLYHPPAAAVHNRSFKNLPDSFVACLSVDKSWSGCRVSSDGRLRGGCHSDAWNRLSALLPTRRVGQPLQPWRHVCTASGHGSTGKAAPDEEDPKAVPDQLSASEGAEDVQLQIGDAPVELDWRAFRAQLVQSEKPGSKSIGTKSSAAHWAHPILAPEAGCVLIATEKLDGQQNFERTVVLLLSPGSSNPREGPYGLILNRPLSRRIKEIKLNDWALVKHFGNCQAYLGGPMDTEVFLLLHGTSGIQGFQEVIPGVYYGTSDGLEPVAEFAKGGNHSLPQGFRFVFGYSGWGSDQLKKEIAAGLWCVAACSSDLIASASTAGLWEEVLQLMGGKYLELSKRPRRKHY